MTQVGWKLSEAEITGSLEETSPPEQVMEADEPVPWAGDLPKTAGEVRRCARRIRQVVTREDRESKHWFPIHPHTIFLYFLRDVSNTIDEAALLAGLDVHEALMWLADSHPDYYEVCNMRGPQSCGPRRRSTRDSGPRGFSHHERADQGEGGPRRISREKISCEEKRAAYLQSLGGRSEFERVDGKIGEMSSKEVGELPNDLLRKASPEVLAKVFATPRSVQNAYERGKLTWRLVTKILGAHAQDPTLKGKAWRMLARLEKKRRSRKKNDLRT